MVQMKRDSEMPKIEVVDVEGLETGVLKINDNDGHFCPIAVTGIGLRMPMCKDMPEFERILKEQLCAIIDIPADRWRKEDYHNTDPHIRGHHVIPAMAFCENYYDFDAGYFGLSARESNFIDPQHRQSMMTTEQAMQDAGYTKDTMPKDTGVFVGMGIIDFPGVFAENRLFYNGQTWAGFSHSCAANRVSNYYGLTGPSCAVDTACAASLTALHMGCMAIWNKECSLAIAGATSNVYSPETTVAFSQLGVLSSTGNSAPFDESNNGYVRGEGTGMVIMKPLDQAIKDGDHIYCAIRATTSAHNGNSNSLTLPSAPAQEELIRRCYSSFGVPLGTVDFVEAHGTGTPVGDPLETKALGRTFGSARPKHDPMPIASAKSSFGHLEVCAGMVQVVKTALMLEKRRIYKQLNWSSPNHRIDFEDLNLRMQLKEESFTKDKKFIIGVNTFGFGGSLVHMIFEEIVSKEKKNPPSTYADWKFGSDDKKGRKIAIPLSAKVAVSLKNTVSKWVEWECPEEKDAQQTTSWLATRREHYMGRRLVVLADSGADFRAKLSSWLQGHTSPDVVTGITKVPFEKPKICFVFSGFTQQYFDMGRALYKNEPNFKKTVDQCDAFFKTLTGYSSLEKFKIFVENPSGADPEKIQKDACKPAILFLQIATHQLLESWGIKADMVMGVGLGEVSAAYACGAITMEDAIRCMVVRMNAPPKEDFLKTMSTVLNGPKPKTATFLSTVTGGEFEGPLDADYWWKNVAAEKNITGAIKSVVTLNKDAIFIEVSAKPVLASIIRQNTDSLVLTTGNEGESDWDVCQRVMSTIHCTGYPVNWKAITRNCAKHAPIPVYGWDEVEYKLESNEYFSRRVGVREKSFKAMGGNVSYDAQFHLMHYTMGEETVFPAAAHTEYMLEYTEDEHASLKNLSFPVKFEEHLIVPPYDRDGYVQSVQLNVRNGKGTMETYGSDGKVYARAETTSPRQGTETPTLDIKAVKERCQGILEPEDMYERFGRLGLDYGESYRLMTDVYLGQSEALGLCDGPHLKNRFERIESVVLDSAFQLAIGAFTCGKALYMPSGIGLLQMFLRKVPTTTPFTVHATLQDWSLHSITCNLTIADNEGKVWATVTGFKATSSIELKTEVDYNHMVYSTKYQFLSSCLPSTSFGESFWADSDDGTCDLLKPIMSAYARQALAEVKSVPENCKALFDKLQKIACLDQSVKNPVEATDSLLEDRPEFQAEIELVKKIGATLPEMLNNPELAAAAMTNEHVVTFLKESDILRNIYEKTASMLNAAIDEAFSTGQKKHVIKICEIGSQNTKFSKCLISGLSSKIIQGSVEYIYTNTSSETSAEVSADFHYLPTIKYETYDPAHISSEDDFVPESCDIVINTNLSKQLDNITSLRDVMTEDAWLLMLCLEDQHLVDFISGSEDMKQAKCDKLAHLGFHDARVLSPKNPALASIVLATKKDKTSHELIGNRWVLLSGKNTPVVEMLKAELPGETLCYNTNEVSAAMASLAGEEKTALIYFVGLEDSSITTTVNLIESLDDLNKPENVSVWAITHGAYIAMKTMPATISNGLLRSYQNRSKSDVHCVDIQPGAPAGVVDDILQALRNIGGPTRETGIRKPAMKVPRTVRISMKPNKNELPIWQAEVSTRGSQPAVTFQTFKNAGLKPTELRVQTKAIGTSEVGEGSCVAFSGIVEAVGDAVDVSMIGDAVLGLANKNIGSHFVTNQAEIMRKPANLGWTDAADSLLSYCTMYNAMLEQAKIKYGETVLIYPSSGSLVQAGVQIAKNKGVKLICTLDTDSDDSQVNKRLGIAVYANPNSPSFEKDLSEFTGGKGVDVVINTSSKALPSVLSSCLAYGARVCRVGSAKPLVSPAPGVRFCALNLSAFVRRHPHRVQKMINDVRSYVETAPIALADGKVTDIAELESRLQEDSTDSVVFRVPDNYYPDTAELTDLQLKKDATYLITGGYGRVGRELAQWFAKKGARHIAIASRTGATDVFQKCTARFMEKQRATVYDVTADVSKQTDVENIFSTLKKEGAPAVKGVFHLAGYTDHITSASEENLRKMIANQAQGAENLHRETLTQKLDLDHFVLFSSMVASFGHPALANLSAVGQHLDAVAVARKFGGLPSLCVQLGHVRGAGCLDEDEDATYLLENAGMKSLHIHEYLDILGSLMMRGPALPPTVAITNQDWTKTAECCFDNSTRIQHLVYGRSLVGSGTGSNARDDTERMIRNYIGDLTGSNPDDIEAANPMTQYGVDSLMSSDIIAWAKKKLGVTLLQTEIFEGLTTNQLLDRI